MTRLFPRLTERQKSVTSGGVCGYVAVTNLSLSVIYHIYPFRYRMIVYIVQCIVSGIKKNMK